jgi:nitroreductase/dihydropteridine reductase
MDFKRFSEERYSCRKFDGRKIEDEKISQIKDIIRNSPSAFNLQPWRIKIISDHKLIEKLTPVVFGGGSQVPTCSHLLVFCTKTDLEDMIVQNVEDLRKEHAPEEIINFWLRGANAQYGPATSSDKRLAEAEKNVYIAVASAVYGAKSLGIDSCIIGGFDHAGIGKILGLTPDLTPTLIVTLGYAADSFTPRQRLPGEEIFF